MLNVIRNHQQVVFESDIFGADGVHVDKLYLTCREHNACWSRWKFSKQKPTSKHLQLWLQAIGQLTAPGDRHSQRLWNVLCIRHKIWKWEIWCTKQYTFKNYWTRRTGLPLHTRTRMIRPAPSICCNKWRNTRGSFWLEHMFCHRGHDGWGPHHLNSKGPIKTWLTNIFLQGHSLLELCLDVEKDENHSMDVWCYSWQKFDWSHQWLLYLRLLPHHLECTKGRGHLVLSFAEQSPTVSAYHGELLGLLAFHLLLLSFNKVQPHLTSCVMIYSDCLGALNRVKHLPTHKITSSCRHTDILKVISLHCLGL